MKKLWVLLLVIAAAAGGLLYYVLSGGLDASEIGQASQVAAQTESSASEDASSEEDAKKKAPGPEVGVMKPLKTQADVMDALAHEMSQNRDTVGWLSIADTAINASVVQSHDNTYYLRKTERREESIYGCYFADFTCDFGDRQALSKNTVIYGHSDLTDNMDGPKFSQLFKFTDREFAKTHPVVYFSTPESYMAWQVFAAFYTDVNLDYINTDPTGEQFTELVQQAKDRSVFTYDVQVGPNDKILTLSTCTIKYGTAEKGQRFVLMARLLPEGELPEQANITVNQNPVQPKFD